MSTEANENSVVKKNTKLDYKACRQAINFVLVNVSDRVRNTGCHYS